MRTLRAVISGVPGRQHALGLARHVRTQMTTWWQAFERKCAETFHSRAKFRTPPTVGSQLRIIFLAWSNILLVLVPAGFAVNAVDPGSIKTFVICFFASFPLQTWADLGLDEIILRMGELNGGLLYITTFNVFQLISAILLLVNRQTILLRTTLIGGILANILLILGLSFTIGGSNRYEQYFNQNVAHISSNLLSLASTSLLIPTASKLLGQTSQGNLTKQSRGAAIILMLVYLMYLYFTLMTHREVYKDQSQPRVRRSSLRAQALGLGPKKRFVQNTTVPRDLDGHPILHAVPLRTLPPAQETSPKAIDRVASVITTTDIQPATDSEDRGRDDPPRAAGTDLHTRMAARALQPVDDDEEEPEKYAELQFPVALGLFLGSNVLLFFMIDYVVNSINVLTTEAHLSRTFIGLILLPLPNCDLGAIKSAIKDKADVVMAYTIGKCLQTALFITPFIVLIAWGLGIDEVNLVFDGFEIVSLFAAILLLNFVVIPGKDTWLQGVLLLADWGLIAIAAYFVDLGEYGTAVSDVVSQQHTEL